MVFGVLGCVGGFGVFFLFFKSGHGIISCTGAPLRPPVIDGHITCFSQKDLDILKDFSLTSDISSVKKKVYYSFH